jgi:hypothetical protein
MLLFSSKPRKTEALFCVLRPFYFRRRYLYPPRYAIFTPCIMDRELKSIKEYLLDTFHYSLVVILFKELSRTGSFPFREIYMAYYENK